MIILCQSIKYQILSSEKAIQEFNSVNYAK